MPKHTLRDVTLDDTTIGDSEACIVLVKMMNENVITVPQKHKVLRFISKAINHFKIIAILPHKMLMWQTLILVRNDYLSRVDSTEYPLNFKTHLKNVITYYARRQMRAK